MLRRPAFWIVIALLSLASTGFAVRYFPLAFPIVSLDITMDREESLQAARDLAAQHQLGPPDFRQAASFALDDQAQTFIELEGGGKDEFLRMMRVGLYAPYTWRVRQFQPGERREVLFRFTPDGQPYGFVEGLREDAPGASLAAEEARRIGEQAALSGWQVNLQAFAPVEQSQERRPGGRTDHTFVYERPGERLGEGRYRLRLTVSGDRLTEVTYFIQVPEAFTRRYEEMRSANMAIGTVSAVAMVLLYLLGGVGVGLFFLLRQRWVIWRQPLLWGGFVALLQVLAALNEWPLLWMTYDTALPTSSFTLQVVARLVAQFLGFTGFFALSFMAAESLTRRAFPSHPQLWRVWSREAAATPSILGRTAAAYLLVGFFFAYEVALYFVTARALGWWTPSEALVHPDVLATYYPWLSAIAPSFQAGFWEECLFRAVPLAGAALIGDRFGGRKLWLTLAMIVQAVVFGAGHAPYPTQPSYARAVELILPSIGFGLLYLRLGLLPAIVLHFAFDTVWFALPIFVSATPGARVDQVVIVLLALVPLWATLGARRRAGRWLELSPALLNGGWQPPPPAERPLVGPEVGAVAPVMSLTVTRGVVVAGIAGAIAWAVALPFRSEIPPLAVGRAEAVALARRVLDERGVELGDRWQLLAAPDATRPGGRFIWKTAGRERYLELLGSYLSLPRWNVRVATFEGPVAERAEQWNVGVSGTGSVERVSHDLPEARPGAALGEDDARRLALEAIKTKFGLAPDQLESISARSERRPARLDWTVTYADRSIPPLPEGQPRVAVEIGGDEVIDTNRFVHVPEEWERQERARQTVTNVAQLAFGVLLVGTVVAAAIAGIVAWTRRRFSLHLFLIGSVCFALVGLGGFFNLWPSLVAGFSTAQPLRLQMLIAAVASILGVTIPALALGIVAGAAPRWMWRGPSLDRAAAVRLAPAVAALGAGVLTAGMALRGTVGPVSGDIAGAGAFLPVASVALAGVNGLVVQSILLLLVVAAADRLTRGWTMRRGLFGALLVLFGFLGAGGPTDELLPWALSGLASGLVLLAVYVLVLRFDPTIVPLAAAGLGMLRLVREGLYRAYPSALPGAVLGILLVGLLGWWWFLEVRRACEAAASDRTS